MTVVIDMQKDENGTVATLPWAFENRNEAEAKYHAVLSAAAVSGLPMHSCVMLTIDGMYIKSECFVAGSPAPAV